MDRCCLTLLILSQLIFCMGTSSTTDAAETEPLTIKEINQTWQQRRERLQAMRVELSQETTSSKLRYMKSNIDDEDVPLTAEETRRYLQEQVKYNTQHSLLLDSPRFRCRSWGRHSDWQLKEMYNHDMTLTTDGQTAAHSYLFRETTHATIFKDPAEYRIFSWANLGPLCWSLLAGDPCTETSLNGFSPQKQIKQIQGLDCTILEKKDKSGVSCMWVAPRNYECVVMQYERIKSGRKCFTYQFQYSNNMQSGPLPTTWEVKQYQFYENQNYLTYASKFKVDSIQSNVTIPIEQFKLKLPPGAHVSDLRKPNPQGGELNYIVQEDSE